jgi:hypothetical protein
MIFLLRNTQDDGPFPTSTLRIAESVPVRLTILVIKVGEHNEIGGIQPAVVCISNCTGYSPGLIQERLLGELPDVISLRGHGGNPTAEVKYVTSCF